ncbi:MAG: radical SAM family heme chaperone HemW [Elusimicrobia bacterium]|nr:radical SAM family heme chaperone HemW [Elusimicrobiota bacterium]
MAEGTGLYVHVPFCSVKCFYCDFTAFSGQGSAADRYVDSVLAEADLYPGVVPDTLYIGGGTPTELSAVQLTRLLRGLAARFGPIAGLRESTVEASPETGDPARLDALAAAGVGRLSFGLQTASDRLLKAIGRQHDFADFRRVWADARARGFSLNVDLMQGLPGQTAVDARGDLDSVLALGPDHISLYTLQVEDRTLFGKREVEVDSDLARETMEDAIERIGRAGLAHYEVSNFARPGREALHNIGYWIDRPGLGLGCGASGFLGGERYQNEEKLRPYIERALRGERPVAQRERLAGKEKLGESLMLRLRLLEGASLTPAMQEAFRPQIARLVERGLVSVEDGGCSRCLPRLRLTREGLFIASEVFREFVPPWETTE